MRGARFRLGGNDRYGKRNRHNVFSNIVASSLYTAPYSRLTSDRIIRQGDFVIIDKGVVLMAIGEISLERMCVEILRPSRNRSNYIKSAISLSLIPVDRRKHVTQISMYLKPYNLA